MIEPGTDLDTDGAPANGGALFANADWQVFDDGLEHRATGYFIARDALRARRGDGLWAWPLHLSEKSWCAPRLFREAFAAALAQFGFARDEALTRSFAVGFGLRPGSASGRDGFVALGELVRPRPVARKRVEAGKAGIAAPAGARVAAERRVSAGAGV